jgi:ferrous iron transport protein B
MQICEKEKEKRISSEKPQRIKKIAIVGLPNTGKSQIFNNLTGQYTIVANYPLTTIEPKRTHCQIKKHSCEVIDTPGLHCLYIHSEEELIVRDMIFRERPDVIIQCINTNLLKQSLILTADLLELGIPIVISLNAIDETTRKGIWIDSNRLSRLIGVPVVELMALHGQGTEELKDAINNARNGKWGVQYGEIIENGIKDVEFKLPENVCYKRKISVLMMQNDPFLANNLKEAYGNEKITPVIDEVNNFRSGFRGNLALLINNNRNKWVDNIAENVIRKQKIARKEFSQLFAHLSRHPIFGLPILMTIVFIMYLLVVNVANVISSWMNETLWIPIRNQISSLLSSGFWSDLFVGDYGILSLGLANALITILPILSVFFVFFHILEDIGYIPNLSVLTKKIFEKVGLSGAAIMPLVLAFGWKTMSTLTTKSIRPEKERFIAICLIAFGIPCAAQLGINIGILGRMGIEAFVIAFSVLLFIDIFVGIVLNKVLKWEEKGYFIQELPVMRLPSPKAVFIKTYYKLYWFLKEAVPVFIIAAAALFIMDKVGILNGIKNILRPVIEGFLGFPVEMVDVLIVCMARHEAAAAMIINLIEKGLLNYVQCIVAVIIIMLIPCFANVGAMIKEMGARRAIPTVVTIYVGSFLLAGSLNWILVNLFKL